ncbi:MAG TPA: hypothetical protein VHB27_17880, partial [Rhodopila sp.]|nr:hypothetical protein [Rhodopila sp.]
AVVHPEGYAVVTAARLLPGALSALVTAVSGAAYPPDPDVTAGLAARLSSATLHGVRIMPAGRLGDGWLVVREEAAVEPPVQATAMAVWDRRFQLHGAGELPEGTTIGALGDDAAGFRRQSPLPSVVLRTLPALRVGKSVAAVPHLRYAGTITIPMVTVTFAPPRPVDGPAFVPASGYWTVSTGPAV